MLSLHFPGYIKPVEGPKFGNEIVSIASIYRSCHFDWGAISEKRSPFDMEDCYPDRYFQVTRFLWRGVGGIQTLQGANRHKASLPKRRVERSINHIWPQDRSRNYRVLDSEGFPARGSHAREPHDALVRPQA